MVPGVVGSNPISHPILITLALAGVLCLLRVESVYNKDCYLINKYKNRAKISYLE